MKLVRFFLDTVNLRNDRLILHIFSSYARMVITFNYKEGTKTTTFAEIDEVFGSDLSLLSVPNSRNPNLVPVGNGFGFLVIFTVT